MQRGGERPGNIADGDASERVAWFTDPPSSSLLLNHIDAVSGARTDYSNQVRFVIPLSCPANSESSDIVRLQYFAIPWGLKVGFVMLGH